MFTVDTSEKKLTIVIETTDFDASRALELKKRVKEHSLESIQQTEVDFTQVEFIDSSGIGALLSIQKKLNPSATPLIIINPCASVLSVIELLRLHKVFNIQKR